MKIAIVLSLGLLMVKLMRREAAATRHWTLAVTIACAAAVPVLTTIAPRWQWPPTASIARQASTPTVNVVVSTAPADTTPVPVGVAAASGPRVAAVWRWLTWIRWVGASVGVIALLIGMVR